MQRVRSCYWRERVDEGQSVVEVIDAAADDANGTSRLTVEGRRFEITAPNGAEVEVRNHL